MKKIIVVLSLFGSIFIYSCQKENQPHQMFIGATLKNTDWVADPSTTYFANRDSLQINGLFSTGNQGLVMKIKFAGVGNYALTKNQASFFTNATGSTNPSLFYKLDTTQTNTISFTQYDVRTNVAAGSFEVHFVKPAGSNVPDSTLSLTNGHFWIQLPPVN